MFKKYQTFISVGMAGIATWLVASWFYGAQLAESQQAYADYKANIAQTMQRLNQREIELMSERQQALSDLDNKHTKEMLDAQENIDSLLNSIRTGGRRVFVRAKAADCRPNLQAASATAGMADGEARVQLDGSYAAALFDIPAYGDTTAVMLSALQDYVTNVCLKPVQNEDKNGGR